MGDIQGLPHGHGPQERRGAPGDGVVEGLVEIALQECREIPVQTGHLELKEAVDEGDGAVFCDTALLQGEKKTPGRHVLEVARRFAGIEIQAGGHVLRCFQARAHGQEQRGVPLGEHLPQDLDLDARIRGGKSQGQEVQVLLELPERILRHDRILSPSSGRE
jgi:hypothetical protein